jgi:hypothetical protein
MDRKCFAEQLRSSLMPKLTDDDCLLTAGGGVKYVSQKVAGTVQALVSQFESVYEEVVHVENVFASSKVDDEQVWLRQPPVMRS